MFLDKDQFLGSSQDEAEKNNNEDLLLNLDDEELEGDLVTQKQQEKINSQNTKSNNLKSGKEEYNFLYDNEEFEDPSDDKFYSGLGYKNQYQDEIKPAKQNQANKNEQIYQYESKDQPNKKSERLQKLKEQFDSLKEKQSVRNQLGTIQSNQFKTGTQNLNDDYADIQQLIPKNEQLQYEPGALEQDHQLPILKEQEAHITARKFKNQVIVEIEEEKKENQLQYSSSNDSDEDDDNIKNKHQKSKEEFTETQDQPTEEQEADIMPASIKAQPFTLTIWEDQNIQNLREFLTRPCPKGYIIQTTINRTKSGFSRFYPKYSMYFSKNKMHLMSAKKRSFNKTSNYVMSLSLNDFKSSSTNALGKVRSIIYEIVKFYGN